MTRTIGKFFRICWLWLCLDSFNLWSRENKASGFVTTACLSVRSGEAVSLLGARAAHTAQTPSVQVSPWSEKERLTGPQPLLLHVVGLASPVPTGSSGIPFAVWRLGTVCLLE